MFHYVNGPQFVHSPTEEHLGYFQDFAIVNKAALFAFNGMTQLYDPSMTGRETFWWLSMFENFAL